MAGPRVGSLRHRMRKHSRDADGAVRISVYERALPSTLIPFSDQMFGRCYRNVMPYASFLAVALDRRTVLGLFAAYAHRFVHPVTGEVFSAPCAEDEIYIAEACNTHRRIGDATLNSLLRYVRQRGFRAARVQTLDVRLWKQLGFRRIGRPDPRVGTTMIRRLR